MGGNRKYFLTYESSYSSRPTFFQLKAINVASTVQVNSVISIIAFLALTASKCFRFGPSNLRDRYKVECF